MKNSIFVKIIALTVCLVLTVSALVSCGAAGEVTYKVNITDYVGTPYTSGIIVNFMKDGQQVAMQACDDKGVAEKILPAGEYDIEFKFTDGEENYYYEKGSSVSSKENEITVPVAVKPTGDPYVLTANNNEHDAYYVSVGSTYVDIEKGSRTYFLFAPTAAGNYEFSLKNAGESTLGYYGATHFVQNLNMAESKNGKFNISVKSDMIGSGGGGTAVYVLGIDTDESENAIICIERIGDPIKTIEDEPWTVYKATFEMSPYTLPESATIKEFDLTASTDTYDLVYNDKDGFYHLDSKNGPLVLVRLAEDCDYIACFKTMLDRSGVVKYFYNDKGEFEKKESYSECLLEYIECADENEGVYPLTEDLKYIIQQRGDHNGWWDIDNPGYIFKDINGNNDTTINPDIAWLLMCCYIG